MISRRKFIASSAASIGGMLTAGTRLFAQADVQEDRVGGMLLGSLIGDALGGPIEFLSVDQVGSLMPGARAWPADRTLDQSTRDRLANSLEMHGYEILRPKTAPYGPWVSEAPRGTITDDSRHKIILMRALKSMLDQQRSHLTQQDLAQQFVRFQPRVDRQPSADLASLVSEGLKEYRYASHWLLGERDPKIALPVERIWSGIDNCSGQMILLPLAAVAPGDPETAYRVTYEVDFVDAPIARDIVSAINAALAAALDPKLETVEQRWAAMKKSLRGTDPYRMREVPFAGRPLTRWLDLAESIVRRSGGRPATAYRLLETEGKPVYYWDAHFTLLVPWTMLLLSDFDPMAAMHLTLDFGHDTDSYAQVLGAMAGAVHGMDIFPESMVRAVESRLLADYGESVDDWVATLAMVRETTTERPQD